MKHFLSAVILLLSSQAYALDWQDSPEIGQIFKQAGVEGTFVVYDIAAQRLTGHDQRRADTRFVPASTFKIANALIGLSAKAVKDVDEILPYGGKPQLIKAWEKDMSLRDAIAISNIPVYQELARRIGLAQMRDSLSKIKYGNGEIGHTVDDFWLVGPLRISAIEQTLFLAQLSREALPFPRGAQKAVRDIIRLEQGDGYALYGKTGWENVPNPGVGWWVGWVEKRGRVYPFALNIDILRAADAGKRVELGKASLQALGLLQEER